MRTLCGHIAPTNRLLMYTSLNTCTAELSALNLVRSRISSLIIDPIRAGVETSALSASRSLFFPVGCFFW